MEPARAATNLKQLTELAALLPALSHNTAIKAYYDSSDKLLKNAEKAHNNSQIDEEYLWLMRFAVLICEHIPSHQQYNKSTEAQRLNKVYRGKALHVFNRLDVLKVELVPFYEEKARLAAEERQQREEVTNPQTKAPSTNMPTEDDLMARLNRLNRPSTAKPTVNEPKPAATEAKVPEASVVKPERAPTPPKENVEDSILEDEETPLDFSIFDIKPKTSKRPEEDADDPRLIPDVEIVDPRLDLSWLEEDPLFGAKNRPANASSSSSSSATSSTNSTIPSRENTLERPAPVSADDASKSPANGQRHSPSPAASSGSAPSKQHAPPPSYDAFKKPSPPVYVPAAAPPRAVEPSFPAPTAKYKVVTVSSEPAPAPAPPAVVVPSSPFSLPSTPDYAAAPDFSITRTVRGQQFDAEAMNQRLLNTTVDATCSTFLPMPSGPISLEDEISLPQTPKSAAASPNASVQSAQALQGPKGPTQYVPVIAGGMPTYATPSGSSSQQQRAAMLSLMGNVPVVFKPNHMNVFDASRAAVPSSSSAVSSTSSASSSKVGSPKPTGAPPAYGSVSAVSGSKSAKKSTPSTAASPKSGSAKHSHADKPPGYKKPSSASSVAKYTGSSAFPLLTNQRPGAAVSDPSLRTIEMEGDMFDRFVSLTNRNTVRGIETCGILAGSFLAQKNIFRVTHLIIPKQTGTSDTCATTNEDEIFEYQIKHDLLTLGWIHTHPTQACFLSSVDLHTQSSYQALFPEAVAVVIAPRDTPNFAFFHLSKSGFPTIQNCPLSGFHHHPERGLYEACSHVVLSWNSKKPCKVVDMR